MRKGSINLWWLIPCTRTTRLRTESKMDVDEILGTELATIDEEVEIDVQNNREEKARKRATTTDKKIKKEEMGRVFTAQFSLKNSYALFLERMTSSRSFGGLQLN
ncbi:hypothetical protein L1987_85701 [Smallanthus sonchifolius]|uniref:Uncharacterized protein n=1 Tax=Smallanthus sonchifolius TaxID=185202 RepID=A0ACB8XY31_9ASTR|nr:hypothetical protein L1987_85701 [Smallanthus sonchifolius]